MCRELQRRKTQIYQRQQYDIELEEVEEMNESKKCHWSLEFGTDLFCWSGIGESILEHSTAVGALLWVKIFINVDVQIEQEWELIVMIVSRACPGTETYQVKPAHDESMSWRAGTKALILSVCIHHLLVLVFGYTD